MEVKEEDGNEDRYEDSDDNDGDDIAFQQIQRELIVPTPCQIDNSF